MLDFGSRGHDAAIVNAANEGCLGGGGVDGAISTAGGEKLFRARLALPVVRGESIRCPTGDARINGPGRYGSIKTNHVIHAVGPNYNAFFLSEYEEADDLLASAYQASLERAQENQLNQVAFSLLSAGLFKGSRTLQQVLEIGVEAIHAWVRNHPDTSIQFIHMCAFTRKEALTLLDVVKEVTANDDEEEEAKDDGDEDSEDEIDVGGETQPSYLPSDAVDIGTEKSTETIEEGNDGENAKDQNGTVTTSDEDTDAAVDQQDSEATDDGAIKTETKDSAATTLEEETATKTKSKEAEEDHPMDDDDENEPTADNIQDTTKPIEEKAEGEEEENSAEKSVETNVANTAG